MADPQAAQKPNQSAVSACRLRCGDPFDPFLERFLHFHHVPAKAEAASSGACCYSFRYFWQPLDESQVLQDVIDFRLERVDSKP
jgi:hypothetical protein